MRGVATALLALALLPGSALAADPEEPEQKRTRHPILFYLPNRVFDVLDLVRARVRFGPGVGLSARVTKPVSASAGLYATLFAGLPGPRGRARIPWPVGMENYGGVDVSVLGLSTEFFNPSYGVGEVGAGFQAGVIGFDVGVDPVEALDLVFGVVFLDILDDDF